MIRRSAKIAIKAVAAGLAGLAVLAGVMMWQAAHGPVSLSLLTPRLEAMINAGLKDFQLRFADSVIDWRQGQEVARLQFVNVEAVDRDGTLIARIPRVAIALSGSALLRGEVAPTRVDVIGASATLVRRADHSFQIGFQTSREESEPGTGESSSSVIEAVLAAMLSPKPDDNLSRYLSWFGVRDAKLTVFDEATRSYWRADAATFAFERAEGGLTATLKAPVKMPDGTIWQLDASANYTKGAPGLALEMRIGDVDLSKLADSGAGLKILQGLKVPANGNATCSLTLKGQFGRCKLWLNVGKGELRLPMIKDEPLRVQSAGLTAEVDWPTGKWSLETLNWTGAGNKAQASGSGQFVFDAEGELAQITTDIAAEHIAIDAPNVFEGPLSIEALSLKGVYDIANARLAIERARLRRGGFDLTLAGQIEANSVSTGVKLDGSFDTLPAGDLKKIWPKGAAEGARLWVVEHVQDAGALRNGKIKIDMPAGALTGTQIPNEMLNFSFDMAALKVTYLEGLPDLTNVTGSAVLQGDTFQATATGGAIGAIAVKTGSVEIPSLSQEVVVGNVGATVEGPTADILAVIDAPRLGYPTRFGVKPQESGGSASVSFVFNIPMLRDLKAEDIGIQVDAELKNLKVPVTGQLKITGGTMNLKVDTKGMKAHGAIQVNGAPMGITWTEDFTGQLPVGTRMDVTATLDDKNRTDLGLDLAPYIEGKNTIQAIFTGRGGKVQNAKIDADITASRVAAPDLNWAKAAGEPARMTADIAFKPDQIEISNLVTTGTDLKAVGRLVIAGGKVRVADFKQLKLGPQNDFALLYQEDENGARTIDAKGRVVNAGNIFDSGEDTPPESKPKEAAPISVKAAFDTAHLRGDVSYQNFRLNYAQDGQRLTAFSLTTAADASAVRGDLVTAEDGGRKLRLYTQDAGKLIRGFTGFRSMVGGKLILNADLAPLPPPALRASAPAAAFDGLLKIENFKLTNQPFLARLFAAGSFTGLGDLLRGEGVTFSRLEQRFQGRGNLITLIDGSASGPSIGLTTQGLINRGTDQIDLNGTLVPLYGLNGMLSEVPLFGELLTSRKGEGIFGMTYAISGPVDELRVAVNPISTLAPGIFRRIFEMGPTPTADAPIPQMKPEATRAFSPQTQGTN